MKNENISRDNASSPPTTPELSVKRRINNPGAGGKRKGAGRPKNSVTKYSNDLREQIYNSGLTPLDYMLNIMRQPDLPDDSEPARVNAHNRIRFEAAVAAAPYVHPKLASVEHKGNKDLPLQVQIINYADMLKI